MTSTLSVWRRDFKIRGITLGELPGVDEPKRDELDYSIDERHIKEA